MFSKIAYASLAAVGFSMVGAAPAQAYDRHHFLVEYRQLNWKERTFHSHSHAHEFADLKRSQGFEVRVIHHHHHYDVLYRLPFWRISQSVHSHYLAHEIANGLRAQGYEARVIH